MLADVCKWLTFYARYMMEVVSQKYRGVTALE